MDRLSCSLISFDLWDAKNTHLKKENKNKHKKKTNQRKKCVLARANLNSNGDELTVFNALHVCPNDFKYSSKGEKHHCLRTMDFPHKILFAIIVVLCLASTNIYSQKMNSTLDCSGAKNCQTCLQDASCFWCETQLLCKVYDLKKREEETKNCGEWRWKTCQKPDTPLIAIISGCASVALICGKSLNWNILSSRLGLVFTTTQAYCASQHTHSQYFDHKS